MGGAFLFGYWRVYLHWKTFSWMHVYWRTLLDNSTSCSLSSSLLFFTFTFSSFSFVLPINVRPPWIYTLLVYSSIFPSLIQFCEHQLRVVPLFLLLLELRSAFIDHKVASWPCASFLIKNPALALFLGLLFGRHGRALVSKRFRKLGSWKWVLLLGLETCPKILKTLKKTQTHKTPNRAMKHAFVSNLGFMSLFFSCKSVHLKNAHLLQDRFPQWYTVCGTFEKWNTGSRALVFDSTVRAGLQHFGYGWCCPWGWRRRHFFF